MSELGLASRREADEWIERGYVRVDGVVVDQLGAGVRPEQELTIEPAGEREKAERVTVLLHKPVGFVSGQAEDEHRPAFTLVTRENRWAGDRAPRDFHPRQLKNLVPAGRLDLDSSGLLVLTQDGRLAKALIGEDSTVEKEYVVGVRWTAQPESDNPSRDFPLEGLERLRHGLWLDGRPLKPAQVSWQNERHLRVVLREGRKRQIRRMCELVGLQVTSLKRIRIGRVTLGELPSGQWRYLGPFERFA
jgi:23S rRNA pseudouridine2604 synthase